ncbi:MAG: sialate O-acetylesterase [Puniceicoccaceae bacterium]
MVLQREKPIKIWGWGEPGEAVNVSLNDAEAGGLTDEDGRWMVELPPMGAGGPHTLLIEGSNTITIEDVLVGEVWIASGQSNMQWTSGRSTNADLNRLLARTSSNIRFNRVRNLGSQVPQETTDNPWVVASPETVNDNTAVGYAFAKTLHAVLGVPIGIIDNAWGGSACEAWLDRSVTAADPQLQNIHAEWLEKEATYDYQSELAAYEVILAEWETHPEGPRPRKPHDEMVCQHRPGNLWNARTLPVAPYTMRGVIWYQGEANGGTVDRATQYHHLFSTMIGEWRQLWGEEFPFYFVQLADYRKESVFAPNETWPLLRESQTRTMETVPNTGQAVIIDIGEGKDIHPQEKEEVGRRLARWALNKDYGYTGLAHRAPEFKAWTQDGETVVVDFNYTGEGLRAFETHSVKGFVVRSEDSHWHVVEGKVARKHSVELKLPMAMTVTAVRYAWANNPVCNLFSLDGLPVTPFRTDTENTVMEENFSASVLYDIDRAFSARAQEVGTAQAFTEFAAEDAVMYRDGSEPIMGREAIGQVLSGDKGSLVWEPVAGDIAASGDLGYTRGKFVYHTAPGPDGQPPVGPFKGYYTSVWKKQADGSWMWVYDGGIITEKPAPPEEAAE